MSQKLVRADTILCGFHPDGSPDLRPDAAILVEDGSIREIGDADTLAAANPRPKSSAAPGSSAIPGLVNAHHHVGLTPLQLGSPDHPLELWFASRLALRDVDPRLDTLYSAFEMIASGVTTVQHLHSRAPGGPEAVLAAARKRDRAPIATSACGHPIRSRCATRTASSTRRTRTFLARVPAEVRPAMRRLFRSASPCRSRIRSASSTSCAGATASDPLDRCPDRAVEPALAVRRGACQRRRDGGRDGRADPHASAGDALPEGLCAEAHRRLGPGLPASASA